MSIHPKPDATSSLEYLMLYQDYESLIKSRDSQNDWHIKLLTEKDAKIKELESRIKELELAKHDGTRKGYE